MFCFILKMWGTFGSLLPSTTHSFLHHVFRWICISSKFTTLIWNEVVRNQCWINSKNWNLCYWLLWLWTFQCGILEKIPLTRCLNICVSLLFFFYLYDQILDIQNWGLFWPTASEISVHIFSLCCFWACGETKHPGGRKGWGQAIVVAGTRGQRNEYAVLASFFPFSL